MKKFAIFGNPVEHSKSPQMHNALFKAKKIEAVYEKYFLEDGAALKEIFLKTYDGANVTVPFKEQAFVLCDEVIGIAKKIGAVNTLVKFEGKMIGYNTDAQGFFKSIENFLPIKSALILGAGGSAKAISFYLKEKNIDITVANRNSKRFGDFKAFKTSTYNELQGNFELIINTTLAGLSTQMLPFEKISDFLKKAKCAVDIVYGRCTPFLQIAQSLGLPVKDGFEMLLYQGVLANMIFLDKIFDFETTQHHLEQGLQGQI